jgi:hypothetical protein
VSDGSTRPKRATSWSFHGLMESMEGPRKQSRNCLPPHATAGLAEDITTEPPEAERARRNGLNTAAQSQVLHSTSDSVGIVSKTCIPFSTVRRARQARFALRLTANAHANSGSWGRVGHRFVPMV